MSSPSPMHDYPIPAAVVDLLRLALIEDIGHGDITTALTVDGGMWSEAMVMAKEETLLAGLPFFIKVFDLLDPEVAVIPQRTDGEVLRKGDIIAVVKGKAASLLMGERVALNILQRLCGIAMVTSLFVREVQGLPVKILDTRKTTPNMRFMEKYAVRTGGGANHRFGLSDGILIKDNHIAAAGGVREALRRVKGRPFLTKVEVEVKTFEELKEALDEEADVIMLDNMDDAEMAQAVALARATRAVILEASGNVTLERVRTIAQAGVDAISSGYLTHSARAADISMKITVGYKEKR